MPAIDCMFNSFYQTFIVLTANGIRIHSAKDGRLLKFRFKESDLHCMAFNIANRKIYTGDGQGRISVLTAEGAIEIASTAISVQSRLNNEIAAINPYYSLGNELMVVANWSGMIKVFKGN